MVVGGEDKVATKKTPSVAKVTYASSDDAVATVDATTGAVKAVKAGKVTITATSDYGNTATTDIAVKTAILKDATQTEVNKIVATIAGDTKDLKAADFKITNTATNATVAVKAATADKKDASKVTIDTFTDMKDAKEYSVTYDGVTVKFTATDGTPAKVGVDTAQIAAATKTQVQATLADANGVILSRTNLDKNDTSKGNVTSEVKLTKGYQDGTNLYLPTVGDTATIKVTYHTGTFGTDGKEAGNIEDTFTITAVDPSLINYNFAITISDSQPAWTAASFKTNDKIAMGADKNAYFRITKDDGTDLEDYSDYSVESADKTKLLVNNTKLADNKTSVAVHGVAEGTTYILVKKDDKTVASLPVTVLAKPVATTMDLSKAAVTVVTEKKVEEKVSVTIKDQYGDAMPAEKFTDLTASILSAPKDANGKQLTTPAADTIINGKAVVVTGEKYTTTGTYQYKLTAKCDGKELTRTFTVNVVKAADKAQSYEVRVSDAEIDTTVGRTDVVEADSKQFTISVAELANGGALDLTNKAIYTIKDAKGNVVYHDGEDVASETVGTVTTSGAIKYDAGKLTVNPYTVNGKNIVKNFAAGSYTVQAKVANGDKVVTVNSSFTIKDSQDSRVSFKLLNNDLGKDTTVAEGFALAKNIEVYYDGQIQDNAKLAVSDIKGYVLKNGNGGAYIKTVKVFVNVSGTENADGNMVQVTLTVEDQLASCASTGITE